MVHIALIPAYKPREVLLTLVRQCRENGLTVVIVDDGSGSEYADVFEKCGDNATILRHNENRGKGNALKTGFAYIDNRFGRDSVIVTLDADGQHKVEDALAVCDIAEKNKDALVLGGRRFEGKVPLRSRFGNAMTRFVYRAHTLYHSGVPIVIGKVLYHVALLYTLAYGVWQNTFQTISCSELHTTFLG